MFFSTLKKGSFFQGLRSHRKREFILLLYSFKSNGGISFYNLTDFLRLTLAKEYCYEEKKRTVSISRLPVAIPYLDLLFADFAGNVVCLFRRHHYKRKLRQQQQQQIASCNVNFVREETNFFTSSRSNTRARAKDKEKEILQFKSKSLFTYMYDDIFNSRKEPQQKSEVLENKKLSQNHFHIARETDKIKLFISLCLLYKIFLVSCYSSLEKLFLKIFSFYFYHCACESNNHRVENFFLFIAVECCKIYIHKEDCWNIGISSFECFHVKQGQQ